MDSPLKVVEQNGNNERLLGQDPEEGANLVEYALLCMLVGVTAIAAVRFLSTRMSQRFSYLGTQT